MNRHTFGNLWARRAELSHRLDALRHSHLWRDQGRSKEDRQPADSNTSVPEELGNGARKERQDALNAWEDEGGTTKSATRR